jgi:hypothetical protein
MERPPVSYRITSHGISSCRVMSYGIASLAKACCGKPFSGTFSDGITSYKASHRGSIMTFSHFLNMAV